MVNDTVEITGPRTIQGSPRSILLIQLGDIGDVVLTLPVIRALNENYPQATIVVVVLDKAAELLENCPWLSQVIAVRQQSHSLWANLRSQYGFFQKLRSFGFDLAFDMRTGTRGAIMAFLSGACQRIAYYAYDGRLWRNRVFTSLVMPKNNPDTHIVDALLFLAESFGVVVKERTPELFPSEESLSKAMDLLVDEAIGEPRLLVAVQPFSLWQYKEWGKEKNISLIRWLIAEHNATVLVTGSLAEQGRAEEIVRNCGGSCYNFAGRTSIGIYAALLKRCHLFIGVDSAGLHIAAAVGTPTVSIFGPSSPDSWAPRGRQHLVVQKKLDCVPCRQKGCNNSEKSRCVEELSVAEVIEKLKAHFGCF